MAEVTPRGRLTAYLGAAPGVGKTYAMLERAQALRRAGTEVVVGVALTHGRAETAALLDGLERLPERSVVDQGVTIAEFDLAAALRRRPRLLLLDELAHSNAPGSRHAKRWQDADELLDAGIDVLTTLNVQHIESLREPVARLTGIEVRERVPDRFLDQADAIELVDLPTEELLTRLRDGKVYLGDGADRALHGFFTPGNLAGLRELALRYVAGRVRAGQAASGLAPGRQPTERLMVAIGPSPSSAWLVRAAKRMADATGATWLAVYAETPATLHLDATARGRIGEHLRLAEQLGGQALTVGGEDVAQALIDAARRHGVRRILVGKPARGRLRDLWQGSLVHDLIRQSGDLEVLAITGDSVPESGPAATADGGEVTHGGRWWSWCGAVVAVGLAIAIALPLRPHLQPANLTLPFLLAVVVVALFGRRGPVILATVAGVGGFDLLCIPPYGSLAVSDTEYLLTFLGMLVVGLTIAHLVARLRRQTDHALSEAEGAAALHRLGGGLATTRGLDQLIQTASALTGEILGCRACILATDAPSSTSLSQEAILRLADEGGSVSPSDLAVAQWVASHAQPAGVGTDTLPAAAGLHLPLVTAGGTIGVLILTGVTVARSRDLAWRRLAEAAARLIALALGCERLNLQAGEARMHAEHERLRATILAGVSHDLRTPLTAIAGLAQQLADDPDPERRRTAQTIADQAERLAGTVRNLLELTRIGSGAVRPRRVPLAAEDAIATAVTAVRGRLAGRELTIEAGACPPLSADETLLHTTLVNLLDNALVHADGPIRITAVADADPAMVAITVADRGPGVPADERERIFQAWQRGRTAAPGGAGLGLALVRAIIEAHGGRVRVDDHPGGGAAFTCTVPRHADA
jgi:two-component system sensor histidine kinase KdpD